jgi:hypothetical protein
MVGHVLFGQSQATRIEARLQIGFEPKQQRKRISGGGHLEKSINSI